MKVVYYLTIVATAFFVTVGESSAQVKNIEGVYASVSESEWELRVELKKSGKAMITEESWYPGEYDDREQVETDATWEWARYDILIHYHGITDTLFYDERLSLKELGEHGGAPGLWQQFKYHPKSKIKNIKLWRKDYFPFGINPPQVLIMPEELVNLAKENGFEQLTDFYTFRPGDLDPCFVYGYSQYEEWTDQHNSAVFWCKKSIGGEEEYYLIISKKDNFWDKLAIDEIVNIPAFPRGLSVFKDTSLSLDQFYYLDDPKTIGPANVKMDRNGIRNYYDGVGMEIYKYNGKWLYRQYH